MNATISRRSNQARKSRSRGLFLSCTPLELLEGRQLMTAVPIYKDIAASVANVGPVAIAPMEMTVVNAPLTSAGLGSVSFQATKGEIVDVNVDASYSSSGTNGYVDQEVSSGYSVQSAQGTNVISLGTGETAFRAPADGLYTVHINAGNYGFNGNAFKATIRPITLDTTTAAQLDPNHNASDANKLSFTDGAMYAFLDSQGSSLNLSGPTGRGFSLTTTNKSWMVSTASDGSTTYTSNGTVSIAGVDLKLPSFVSLVVTTKPQTGAGPQGATLGNKLFAEVSGTTISLDGVSMNSLLSPMTKVMNIASDFTSEISNASTEAGVTVSTPGLSYGIALGDTLNNSGAPLNAAVPYIYLTYNGGVSASYGQLSVSVGAGPSFSAAVDPIDPSFYVNVSNLPLITNFALAGSLNGLLPYTPSSTIIHQKFQGDTGQWNDGSWIDAQDDATPTVIFYGNIYAMASLDLGEVTDDVIPVTLTGDITVNLDPTHLGAKAMMAKFDTYTRDLSDVLLNKPSSGNLNADMAELKADILGSQVGLDGSVAITFGMEGASLSFPVAQASAFYDGQAKQVYFHAGSVDPLKGTDVGKAFQLPASAWDGRLSTTNKSDFSVSAQGDLTLFGQKISSGIITIDPTGYTVMGWASFDVTLPSAVEVVSSGSVLFKMTPQLMGTIELKGSAYAVIAKHQTVNVQYDETINVDVKKSPDVWTRMANEANQEIVIAAASVGDSIWSTTKNAGKWLTKAGNAVWTWGNGLG